MIKWMPIDEAVPINLENAVSVIRSFSKRGLNTVVPYPLSSDNYSHLMNELKDIDTKIHIFTLAPKLEIALTNRGTRELEDRERERIRHHYRIGSTLPLSERSSITQINPRTIPLIISSQKYVIVRNLESIPVRYRISAT